MNESTTGIDIVPLTTGQDVLTEVLQDGARRMLAQAIESEAAAWIRAHDPRRFCWLLLQSFDSPQWRIGIGGYRHA